MKKYHSRKHGYHLVVLKFESFDWHFINRSSLLLEIAAVFVTSKSISSIDSTIAVNKGSASRASSVACLIIVVVSPIDLETSLEYDFKCRTFQKLHRVQKLYFPQVFLLLVQQQSLFRVHQLLRKIDALSASKFVCAAML